MIFNKVKGYDDVRVLIGLLCSRQRVARLFGTTPEKPGVYAQRLRGESYRANHHPARPRRPARRWYIWQAILISIFSKFCLRRLTPRKTQVPTLPSACAMPRIRKPAIMMSPSTACAYRAKTKSRCISYRDVISILSGKKPRRPGKRCLSRLASAWIRRLKLAPALSRRPPSRV